MPTNRLLLTGAAVVASVALGAPASAEPGQAGEPYPYFPNVFTDYCPGGKGGKGPEWRYCDGVKYPDGSYWRQNSYETMLPNIPVDSPMASGRHCVIDISGDHNGDPNGFQNAPPGGCNKAV